MSSPAASGGAGANRIVRRVANGETWRNLRTELDKLHLGQFTGPAGEVAQRTEITPRQAAIFKAAAVAEPPRYVRVATPQAAPATAG